MIRRENASHPPTGSRAASRRVPTYQPQRVTDEQGREMIRQAIIQAPNENASRALRPAS
jgi:hypothetical protein